MPRCTLFFFAGLALAMLQNVTVDDAVLTGAVVPQYLPTDSVWNIGNNCTTCVKANPTMAYNGTWHDTTYDPGNNYTQAIEFTFTGIALYIFFITANNVPYDTTFTDVDFVLDQATVGRYTHTPSSSTDYQYNVLVYGNESIGHGEHNMMIQPVETGNNNVLMLFDYFIYTMDVSVSSSATSSSTSSPSPTTSGTATSPSPNIGAIVGGVVGGVAAVALVATLLLCYRRHKKRDSGQPPMAKWTLPVVEPFLSHEVAQAPLAGTTSSTYPNTLVGFLATEPTSRNKTHVSSMMPRPSIPHTSTPIPSSSRVPPSSGNNDALLEQVEQLRDEVARLRDLHGTDRQSLTFQSEAPPGYS